MGERLAQHTGTQVSAGGTAGSDAFGVGAGGAVGYEIEVVSKGGGAGSEG